MRDWRADFRGMADELRREDGREAVARLLEHVGDLESQNAAQLEAAPWTRDLRALDYDELKLASAALHRLRDRALDTGRSSYVESLDRILETIDAESRRRAEERRTDETRADERRTDETRTDERRTDDR